MNFKESFIRRKRDIKGKAVGFRIDEVRLPNKKKATREYLHHPGAVAVIPLLPGNRVIMVQQYRYPVGQSTWEIPAGKLDKNEDPLVCVKRELQEETGYSGGKISKLVSFWPTAAFANEVIHIYVARNLKAGKSNPDEDEFLSAKAWPFNKLIRAIMKGKIKDSKTIIALLAYKNSLKR